MSGSAVRRVLSEEGLAIEGPPAREPVPRNPWPDWLAWKPDSIWAYDFTRWTRARRASIAILDVVSRKWLVTLTSAEETSTPAGAAFTAAPDAEGLPDLADERATAALRGHRQRRPRRRARPGRRGQVPLLLAISDNGPQMLSQKSDTPHSDPHRGLADVGRDAGRRDDRLGHGPDLHLHAQHGGIVPPLCSPWLGKVFSLTGATAGYPTLDEARATGFHHPNCGCTRVADGSG